MGNCLDKALSDEEDMITSTEDSQSLANSNNQLNQIQLQTQQQRSNSHNRQRRHRNHNHHHHHHHHISSRSQTGGSISLNSTSRVLNNSTFLRAFTNAPNDRFIPSTNNMELSSSPFQQFLNSSEPIFITPTVQRTADQLTEEDQIKLLKRMALIQQLPCDLFDDSKKIKECVICMIDFSINDKIKYLPCKHSFHTECIDSWLKRSLYCPSCMEPVDAGLLSAFDNQ